MKIVAGIFYGVAVIINLIVAVIANSIQISVIHLLIAILYASAAICMFIAEKGE